MITTRAPDGANKLEICNIASDISAKFVIVQDKVKEENSEAAWQQSVQKGTAAVTAQSQSMLLVALKSRKFWKCDLRQSFKKVFKKKWDKTQFSPGLQVFSTCQRKLREKMFHLFAVHSFHLICRILLDVVKCQMIQNESESEKMFSVVPRPSSWQDVIAENISNKKPWWSFMGLVAHQWWNFVGLVGLQKKPFQTETGPRDLFFY